MVTLYIAGAAPQSARAVREISELLRKHTGSTDHLEVVDVYRDPARAARDGIIVVPAVRGLEAIVEASVR